jgi:hypothetical protein
MATFLGGANAPTAFQRQASQRNSIKAPCPKRASSTSALVDETILRLGRSRTRRPVLIKSGGVYAGFGFPPKAEPARPTGKAFPSRFPPGNAAAFQETGSRSLAMKRCVSRFSLPGAAGFCPADGESIPVPVSARKRRSVSGNRLPFPRNEKMRQQISLPWVSIVPGGVYARHGIAQPVRTLVALSAPQVSAPPGNP